MSKAQSNLRYEMLRRLAQISVMENAAIPHMKLTDITDKALRSHEQWVGAGRIPPNGGWNWRAFMVTYRKVPARFELAIWHKDQLCGLSAGVPSKSKMILKIQLIEGTTEENPLAGRIAPIATVCAEAYGVSIGADELRISEPANASLINYYSKLGFVYKPGSKKQPHYLTRFIGVDNGQEDRKLKHSEHN